MSTNSDINVEHRGKLQKKLRTWVVHILDDLALFMRPVNGALIMLFIRHLPKFFFKRILQNSMNGLIF